MQNQITTTLKNLRKQGACIEGYNKLVRSLQGIEFTEEDAERETYIRYQHTEEIPLSHILASNGLDDALWALRASNATTKDCRLLVVAFAKEVRHLMTDARSLKALEVAELHAYNKATDEELAAAWEAARGVSDAAWVAVANDAALAAWAAARSASATVWGARAKTSKDAKTAIMAEASDAARVAARSASMASARAVTKEKQTEIFKQYLDRYSNCAIQTLLSN